MPQIVKPNTYSSGAVISSAEVNANEDAIINALNALDEDNFDPSTQIPNSMLVAIAPTKVDDFASTSAQYFLTTSPGTTAVPSLPSDLSLEMRRLRYRLLAISRLTNTYYTKSDGTQAQVAWVEPAIVGPQLLSNNGFEVKTSATANVAPDGWTAVGPATSYVVTANADTSFGKNKRSVVITAAANGDGLSYVAKGLKASTKYLIGAAFVRGSGTFSIQTTGGVSGADYQNLTSSLADGSTVGAAYLQGVVSTDSSANDVTVKFLISTGGGGSNVAVYQVWMYELRDQTTLDRPYIPMQTANYTTANDSIAGGAAATWTNKTALTLAQFIPQLGYRLRYAVTLSFKGEAIAGSVRKMQYAFRIQQKIDAGAAATVEGPYSWISNQQTNAEFIGGVVRMEYVIENPVPGSTYTFSTDIFVENDGADEAATIVMNPTVGGGTAVPVSRATLTAERL